MIFDFNLVGFLRRTNYFLALFLSLYFFHFSFDPPQNKSRLLIYPEIITLVYFRTYFRVSTSIDSLVGSIRNLRVDLSLGFRFHSRIILHEACLNMNPGIEDHHPCKMAPELNPSVHELVWVKTSLPLVCGSSLRFILVSRLRVVPEFIVHKHRKTVIALILGQMGLELMQKECFNYISVFKFQNDIADNIWQQYFSLNQVPNWRIRKDGGQHELHSIHKFLQFTGYELFGLEPGPAIRTGGRHRVTIIVSNKGTRGLTPPGAKFLYEVLNLNLTKTSPRGLYLPEGILKSLNFQ